MSEKKNDANDIKLPKDPFAYIAFWQFLTFIMLLLMIWLNELRDMQSFFFNSQPEGINYFRGFLLTAGVFLTAMITIGNTYVQQKRVLRSLVSVCAKCHRVQIHPNLWAQMEDYISDKSLLTFTHGLCPICMAETMHEIETRPGKKVPDHEGKPDTA